MDNYQKSKTTVSLNVSRVSKRARELYSTYREADRITGRQLQALCDAICQSLRIKKIKVNFGGVQPSVRETNDYTGRMKLKKKRMGRYVRKWGAAWIEIYEYTAVKRERISPKTAIETLLHEIMHHWDYEKLKLSKSLHTSGFYIRIGVLRDMLKR